MMENPTDKLSYFLSEKKAILIVSLIGPLVRTQTQVLDDCIREVNASSARWVILNFRDVPSDIEQALIPTLVRFQKQIREKPAELRIAGLHPQLRKALETRGIVRQEELHNNLSEVLQTIAPLLHRAA